MTEFDRLCEMFENIDPETYLSIIMERSVAVLQDLTVLSGDEAPSIFMDFIIASIAADGRLDENEYILVRPYIEALFNMEVSYEEAVRIFETAGLDKPKGMKDSVDRMVDVIGLFSREVKDDIIIICMMICAIDGVISEDEKDWIKQLID